MDHDFYIQLIHQSLSGELSAADEERLAAWRSADPEHEVLEAQVRKGWELSKNYEPEIAVDSKAAFNQLRTRVRAHEAETLAPKTATIRQLTRERATARRNWLAIAASVLLLATAAGWLLWPGQSSPQFATVTHGPESSISEVSLPDGTLVTLRKGATLSYPELFVTGERPVNLTGEAFFQVAKNADSPFRISLPDNASVEVLGTSFSIDATNSDTLNVQVFTGRVALKVGQKSLNLVAEEAGQWLLQNRELTKTDFRPNRAAWRINTLFFRDRPLAEVVDDLEQFFDVAITIANPGLEACRFSGRFPDAEVDASLDALKATFGLEWTLKNGTYELSGGSCE